MNHQPARRVDGDCSANHHARASWRQRFRSEGTAGRQKMPDCLTAAGRQRIDHTDLRCSTTAGDLLFPGGRERIVHTALAPESYPLPVPAQDRVPRQHCRDLCEHPPTEPMAHEGLPPYGVSKIPVSRIAALRARPLSRPGRRVATWPMPRPARGRRPPPRRWPGHPVKAQTGARQ